MDPFVGFGEADFQRKRPVIATASGESAHMLLALYASIGTKQRVLVDVVCEAAEGEELVAIGIVLGEEAVVNGIVARDAPAYNHVVATETKGSAGG